MIKTVYIPRRLDIDKLLKEYPPSIKAFSLDKLQYIISLPNEIPAYSERARDLNLNGYVPINIQKLRGHGIPNATEYIEYLLTAGVFITDNHYIPGKKSRGYKVSDKYNDKVKEVTIKAKSMVTPAQSLEVKKLDYLHKWYNESLTIDYDCAVNMLGEELKDQGGEDYGIALLKHNSQYINVAGIHHHQNRFKVDQTGLRLHTHITTLNSKFRRLVRYDGLELVSLDIKNSQPYLFTWMLHPGYYQSGDLIKRPPKVISVYNLNNTRVNTTNTIMMRELEVGADNQDVVTFTKLVESGRLYEYLSIPFTAEVDPKYKDRGATKEAVFRCLFAPNGSNFPERVVFDSEFPTVAKICRHLRRGKPKGITVEGVYKLLPIQLQRLESWLVLRVICPKLARMYPEMPMFTIHDSIAVPVGYEYAVHEVMEEELTSYVGIKPTIKMEVWI